MRCDSLSDKVIELQQALRAVKTKGADKQTKQFIQSLKTSLAEE